MSRIFVDFIALIIYAIVVRGRFRWFVDSFDLEVISKISKVI